MVHPFGPRPRSLTDDDMDPDDEGCRVAEYRVKEVQWAWDVAYRAMPFFSRLRCWQAGEITEPVGTNNGEELQGDLFS